MIRYVLYIVHIVVLEAYVSECVQWYNGIMSKQCLS